MINDSDLMVKEVLKRVVNGRKVMMALSFIILPLSFSLCACSSDSDDDSEYANWEEKNEAMIARWATDGSLTKYLTYSKNANITAESSDYVYVEVLESGSGTASPLYTDTVRVSYRGKLIPSKSYPSGLVFDENYSGDFSWSTASTTDFCCSGLVDGFSTAVMQMKAGDRWRIHVPYQLGYGTSAKNAIPGYSDLIFDVALVEFWHPGEKRPKFK